MIKYALHCANGHAFESWFQSGPVFDAQAASGLVSCPVCQSSAVVKAIMAPAVARSDRDGAPVICDAPAPPDATKGQNVALLSAADAERRATIVELRRRILEHSVDLGAKFAEEALKIHQGIVPDRPIHGQASFEEARALIEEGVDIMPIPRLPGEFN
ncbi:MAG: DUF1178 family protein [Methylocella sp.]